MTNKEIKELIQDLYDMSCIDDQIKDLIKEIKCEDDVEHCAYLIVEKRNMRLVEIQSICLVKTQGTWCVDS